MIIDGKSIAGEIYAQLGTRELRLGILVGKKNPVIDSFVRIKEKAAQRLRVQLVREELEETATTETAIAALFKLASSVDGVIVQLPLPKSMDVEKILAAIPPQKDVDGISLSPMVRPPVAEAVAHILAIHRIEVQGKHAVVIGSGRLVGVPVAALLSIRGADVTIIQKGDLLSPLMNADVIVSGAGESGLIKPEHIKHGVVLIDAGTSESEGKVAGDADPACAAKAGLFTPVPGGVGPIAVAMIFKNLFELAKK